MTRGEQAMVRRIERRIYNLRVALQIILTWIQIESNNAEDLMYRISKFCVERLEEEKSAARKDSGKEGA